MAPDGAHELAGISFFGKELGHDPGDNDAGVGSVMNEVVRDAVFAALPEEDAG